MTGVVYFGLIVLCEKGFYVDPCDTYTRIWVKNCIY
jgi:hypothetical protein